MSGFELKIDIDKSMWDSAKGEIEEKQERAMMWAMREAGRRIIAAGRGTAPVKTGRLRNSIKSCKNIKGGRDQKYMLVGPFGEPMAFYSGVQQERKHYMQPEAGNGRAHTALREALTKILAKFG